MLEKNLSGKEFKEFGYKIFENIGVQGKIYKLVVDSLVETSLRGVDSHGVRLIPHYANAAIIGRINKNPKFSFKKTGLSTGVLDANHGYGIAAGISAMEQALKLAKKCGIGAVAAKNSSHFGAAAIYSLLAAKKNMIGLTFTHADSLVFPYAANKPFLGTNPICFAAPCKGEEPFCLDIATTPISWNKLLIYKKDQKKLQKGWAANKYGKETIDPNIAVGLMPIAFYKGYGLSLMIEIFSSLLTGMSFGPHINPMYPLNKKKRFLGHFFIAIDIAKFEDVSVFKGRLRQMMNELRSLSPASGFDKVRVPGDPEKESYAIRSKAGIPISEYDLDNFIRILDELKINDKSIRQSFFSGK